MEDRIHLLIIAYLRKEATQEEQTELLKWLDQSEENQRYFRSMKDAYDLGQFEFDLPDSHVDAQWKKLLQSLFLARQKNKKISFYRQWIRYAAVFIFGLVCMQLTTHLMNKDSDDIKITRIETGIGERSKVNLPDGSTVWLNACSSIRYDESFGKKERSITLEGEAFFDVETNKAKPFLVHSDKFTYQVTGTSFNVYSFDNEDVTSIVLIEGSIIAERKGYHERLLPGDILEYNKVTQEISKKKTNVNLYANWRNGELIFDKMTFEDLTKRLERNFNVSFKFENAKIKKESFGGTFRNYDSLETILKVISTSTPIKYRIEKDTVYIK